MNARLVLVSLLGSCLLSGQTRFLDSVQSSIRTLPAPQKITHLYALADAHAGVNLPESRQIAEAGLALAREQHDADNILEGYLLMGRLAFSIADFPFADSMFRQVLAVAVPARDQPMIMKAKFGLAQNAGPQGRLQEERELLEEVMELAGTLDDSLTLARARMRMGINAEKQSRFEEALTFYYQALSTYEKLDDRYRVGIVHTNIGMTMLRLNRFEEALAEFETAMAISRIEDDTEGIMVNLLNIGVVHQKLKQFDKARTAYNQSMDIATAMGAWADIAILTGNLGTVAMQEGQYDDALAFLKRAEAIKDSIGLGNDLPHTVNSLAEVYMHLGDYEMAIRKANEAVMLSRRYDRPDQLSFAYSSLSKAYAAQDNYALAYEYLLLHKQLSDSIYSLESDQAVSNLKIRYETAIKESQIEELTAENQRRKTAQLVYSGIALLILVTGASLVYALYTRRTRDNMLLAKERELHELQNRFFANISHEFRTPLTLILGPVHTLRRQWKDTIHDPTLRTIQKNAERLLQLINQILDLTRFDMKTLELKKEWLDATRMIRGICSSFDSLAEDRGIRYTYDVDEDMVLYADQSRLEVVLTNLITNAFKFTPDEGSIAVTAGFHVPDSSFVLKVRDSGIGIPEEALPKIFNRYYHDDRQAHADFEGMGIGLDLSRHIVEMHGGIITVESRQNKGSVFTVTLPREPGEVPGGVILRDPDIMTDTLLTESVSVHASSASAAKEDRPIVLLVEDRKDMRTYIASLLQDKYHVIESPDAFEGLASAIEHVPDVVISDVMMPGKSGLELCAELKTDMRTSHVPVLLLTAKSSAEDRISGLETEADVYLTKPFIPEELELHLRNLITWRQKVKAYYTRHRRIEPSEMAFNSLDQKFLEAVAAHLEAHYAEESYSVELLAEGMNLSRSQLHRKLNALTGQAPNRLIRTYRLRKAYDMVRGQAATIAEIAYSVGFSSPAYFTKCFVEEFDITPGEARSRASID